MVKEIFKYSFLLPLVMGFCLTGTGFCQEYKVNVDEYFQLGVSYGQNGKFDKSKEIFEKLVNDFPNDPKAHFFLGKSYLSLKNNDLAKDELTKALTLDPNLYFAMDDLASINLMEKKYDAAKALLEKSIKLEPKNYIAHYNLGLALIGMNNIAEAKKEAEILKTFNPQIAELLDGAIKKGKLSGENVILPNTN